MSLSEYISSSSVCAGLRRRARVCMRVDACVGACVCMYVPRKHPLSAASACARVLSQPLCFFCVCVYVCVRERSLFLLHSFLFLLSFFLTHINARTTHTRSPILFVCVSLNHTRLRHSKRRDLQVCVCVSLGRHLCSFSFSHPIHTSSLSPHQSLSVCVCASLTHTPTWHPL